MRELEECGIIYKESIYHEKRTAVFYYLEEEYRNLESVINSLYEFTKYYARLNEIEIG